MRKATSECGKRVLDQLYVLGKSQKDLAEELGISATNINRYISGEREPDVPTIVNIARALHTTTDYLLVYDKRGSFEEEYGYNKAWIARNVKNMTPEQRLALAGAVLCR